MFWQVLFGAGNQGNHQNFWKSLLTNKLWHVFIGRKQKIFFFWKRKSKMADFKKSSFSSSANSQYFFLKISWIDPWVCKIDWCGSTYMVVKMLDISSKMGKKCIFCVFRLFLSLCQTVSRPYRLSHTNALCMNQFY